jgi:ferrous iron transport protein A
LLLSATSFGDVVVVVSVDASAPAARLKSVGFVPGTVVRVGQRAPLGDPTLYELRGTQFALRSATAALIEVEPEAGVEPERETS